MRVASMPCAGRAVSNQPTAFLPPQVKFKDSIKMTLDFFLRQAVESGEFTTK